MVHVVLASRVIPLTLEASTSTDHFSNETPTSIGCRPFHLYLVNTCLLLRLLECFCRVGGVRQPGLRPTQRSTV